MKALSEHETLKNIVFDRNGSVVQALTLDAHKGYQYWHREIDLIMTEWLSKNIHATVKEFGGKMYELYNTPEMIARFGMDAINYIKEMLK